MQALEENSPLADFCLSGCFRKADLGIIGIGRDKRLRREATPTLVLDATRFTGASLVQTCPPLGLAFHTGNSEPILSCDSPPARAPPHLPARLHEAQRGTNYSCPGRAGRTVNSMILPFWARKYMRPAYPGSTIVPPLTGDSSGDRAISSPVSAFRQTTESWGPVPGGQEGGINWLA